VSLICSSVVWFLLLLLLLLFVAVVKNKLTNETTGGCSLFYRFLVPTQ
jgi:hypothetical protein